MLSLTLEKVGETGLAHEEGAAQVHAQDELPALEGEILGARESTDASDVAEDVGLPQLLDARRDRGTSRTRVGGVGLDREGLSPRLLDLRHRLGQSFDIDVRTGDSRTLFGEAFRAGAPDSRGPTGDQHDLVCEPFHGDPLLR